MWRLTTKCKFIVYIKKIIDSLNYQELSKTPTTGCNTCPVFLTKLLLFLEKKIFLF